MNFRFNALFAAIKALDKPTQLIVNEIYIDGGNSITLKKVRCPGNIDGARAINDEIANEQPIRVTLDDLNTVVTANGWGFEKPRTRNGGFEYIYYLQPVSAGDIGLKPEMALFGVDVGWVDHKREVRHQRRFDGYMMRKHMAAQ